METRLSILFYGRKTLQKADQLLAIYLRVTINGQRFEVVQNVMLKRVNGLSGLVK